MLDHVGRCRPIMYLESNDHHRPLLELVDIHKAYAGVPALTGATLTIQTEGSNAGASVVGSAQLTTAGNISGFAIFRYDPTGQEAVVPLETRNASAYMLAFDNTNGVATGLALASVSSQAANVPVVVRDDTGAILGTEIISLAAHGHASFVLTDRYAFAAAKRGTVEFNTPAGVQISVLGLRGTSAGAVTTIPVLAK